MMYSHRQVAVAWIVLGDAFGVGGLACLALVGRDFVLMGIGLIVVGVVMLAFSVLRSTVADGYVTATFTFGWPRHRIALTDIEHAEPVRNSALTGWGLRKIGGGWMYNVWGLDAVEITRRNDRKFRIGTDDPQGLHVALRDR